MKTDGICANCGQVTVDGSTLCIDCLPQEREKVRKKDDELICLRLQLKLSRSLLKHVFAEYQKLQKVAGVERGKIG